MSDFSVLRSRPDGWELAHKSAQCVAATRLTLSFSCVSRIVFPSDFLRQLCPSRRKKRVAFRLNRKSVPPGITATHFRARPTSRQTMPSARAEGCSPCEPHPSKPVVRGPTNDLALPTLRAESRLQVKKEEIGGSGPPTARNQPPKGIRMSAACGPAPGGRLGVVLFRVKL